MSTRRIVIVGIGWAGWALARRLDCRIRKIAGTPVELTVINPTPAAFLSPLIAPLVGGLIQPWQAFAPLRPHLRACRLIIGSAVSIDPARKLLQVCGSGVDVGTDPQSVAFDDLVLAIGRTSHASAPGAADRVLFMRTFADAQRLVTRLRDALSAASSHDSSRRRRALLTIAVVGSDLLAVQTALLIRRRLRCAALGWPRVDREDPQVILVAPSPPCGAISPTASQTAMRALADRQIEVRSGNVLSVEDDHLVIAAPNEPSHRLETRTVVWCQESSSASLMHTIPQVPADGFPSIEGALHLTDHPDLYALGQCARRPDDSVATTPSQLVHDAKWLADRLIASATKRSQITPSQRPSLDALWFDGSHGLVRLGSTLLSGRLGCWLARSALATEAPGGCNRALIRSGWISTHDHDPLAYLGDGQQPRSLYLTPPPLCS